MASVLKVKLYPTTEQKNMLDRHFDAYRFCYNLCLEYKSVLWSGHRVNISGYSMGNELLRIRKEVDWLSLCKAECIRQAAISAQSSFVMFFKGNGYPKFKSKKGSQSFQAYQGIYCRASRIVFFGHEIKYKDSNKYVNLLEGFRIKQITFKRDLCGDYWACCTIDHDKILPTAASEESVGIDLGIKDLVITSEGEVFPNNQYLRNQQYQLRKLQRRFSKSKKGGKNREKLRLKIAHKHRKVTRQKEHYYHQITNQLIRENQTIVMETLSAKNMMKNHKLARSISDASWGLLTSMLEYKCAWHGRNLIKISKWFPSSKTCSGCGNVKEELKLSERMYICSRCNMQMDRDINAAINIKNVGLKTPEIKPVENTEVTQVYEAGSKQLIDLLTFNTYSFG